MPKLSDLPRDQKGEKIVEEYMGVDFVADLLDWDGETDIPEQWPAMALAYARLAFVMGYQLHMREIKNGGTEHFAAEINRLGYGGIKP